MTQKGNVIKIKSKWLCLQIHSGFGGKKGYTIGYKKQKFGEDATHC